MNRRDDGRRRRRRGGVAGQWRPAVGAEATVGRIPSTAADAALLARHGRGAGRSDRGRLGRAELQRRRGGPWHALRGLRAVRQMNRRWCRSRHGCGGGRIQAVPTILAELETVRVVPAAAAAVHDVEASSAVRTESCPTWAGRYPTRPATATNAYQRDSGSRTSMTSCTASQWAMPKPRGPSARMAPSSVSVKRRNRTGS